MHQNAGSFNVVWMDMVYELTYTFFDANNQLFSGAKKQFFSGAKNQLFSDAKNQLFSGVTQQLRAIEEYLKAPPIITSVSENLKEMAHMNPKHTQQPQDIAEKDITLVKEIKNDVQKRIINPFKPYIEGLVNTSNGQK